MRDGILIVLGIIAGAVAVTAICLAVVIPIERYTCSKLSRSTGIETRYVFAGGGCLVKVNDRFIPRENWRGEYQQ